MNTTTSRDECWAAKPGIAEVKTSSAHRWRGTLAVDIVPEPTGECRHDHLMAALQMWSQPLSVRPLRGPGGWRTIRPGGRLWLAGEEQHYEWREGVPSVFVFMTPERIEEILERPYSRVNLDRWRGVDFDSPFVARLVAAMSDDISNDCPAGPIVGDSLTAALVAYLDAGPRHVMAAESRPTPSAHAFERVLEYIEARLAEPLRIAELAREAGCSPKQLSRAFRDRLGVLPHWYVQERRVRRAIVLIDAGELGLARVAAAVGFADQSQMTKIFRQLRCTTPGRIRTRQVRS
jgi:AraC family transcriptional regulator